MVNEDVARAKLATPSGQQLNQADALVIGTIHKPQPICKLGDRFDRLVALGLKHGRKNARTGYFFWRCDCGKVTEAQRSKVMSGHDIHGDGF